MRVKILSVIFIVSMFFIGACALQKETVGEYVTDSEITTKVKTMLFREPNLKSYEISVETYKGEVQLSGFVGTRREAVKAGSLAKNAKGVKSVTNNIRIKK